QHAGQHGLAPAAGQRPPLRLHSAGLEAAGRHRLGRRRGGPGAVLEGGGRGTPRPGRPAPRGRGRRPRRPGRRTGDPAVTPEAAMERLNLVMAHAWMVRNFLKHADEVQEDEEILEVHRMIFDVIRAVEPSRERGDHKEYLRRLKGKLPKLRRVAELFVADYRRVSTHTNFEM